MNDNGRRRFASLEKRNYDLIFISRDITIPRDATVCGRVNGKVEDNVEYELTSGLLAD